MTISLLNYLITLLNSQLVYVSSELSCYQWRFGRTIFPCGKTNRWFLGGLPTKKEL